jgi:hypothetical protein
VKRIVNKIDDTEDEAAEVAPKKNCETHQPLDSRREKRKEDLKKTHSLSYVPPSPLIIKSDQLKALAAQWHAVIFAVVWQ